MSFTVLKEDIFFIRLKSSDYKKWEYVAVLSLNFIEGDPKRNCSLMCKDSAFRGIPNSRPVAEF